MLKGLHQPPAEEGPYTPVHTRTNLTYSWEKSVKGKHRRNRPTTFDGCSLCLSYPSADGIIVWETICYQDGRFTTAGLTDGLSVSLPFLVPPFSFPNSPLFVSYTHRLCMLIDWPPSLLLLLLFKLDRNQKPA